MCSGVVIRVPWWTGVGIIGTNSIGCYHDLYILKLCYFILICLELRFNCIKWHC